MCVGVRGGGETRVVSVVGGRGGAGVWLCMCVVIGGGWGVDEVDVLLALMLLVVVRWVCGSRGWLMAARIVGPHRGDVLHSWRVAEKATSACLIAWDERSEACMRGGRTEACGSWASTLGVKVWV